MFADCFILTEATSLTQPQVKLVDLGFQFFGGAAKSVGGSA